MIISRGWNVIKSLPQQSRLTLHQVKRSSHQLAYRTVPHVPRYQIVLAEILGGFTWWWLLWHIWHDHAHVTGEWEYPDTSKWTDEELGIPPDDED